MKKTVFSKMRKYLVMFVMLGLAALPFTFGGCEKEPTTEKPNPSDTTQQADTIPTPPIQKHNVELVYGMDFNTQWQNIAMDTLYKYNDDPTVDTIFMIPQETTQFVNPNKVFGKGDMVLNSGIINNHPEIVGFFADTMLYNVVLPTKTR